MPIDNKQNPQNQQQQNQQKRPQQDQQNQQKRPQQDQGRPGQPNQGGRDQQGGMNKGGMNKNKEDEEGKKIGIEFEEVPRLAVLQWHIGPEPYVLFELNGKRLLHKIPRNTKHPAQFARQVVATLLEMPERTDWKVCTLEKDVEAQQAKQFREMFMPYDPNFVIPQDASKDVGQQ